MINSSTRGWRSKEKGRGFRRETAPEVEGRRGTRAPFSFLAPPKLLLTHLKQPFPSLSSACHSGKKTEHFPYRFTISSLCSLSYPMQLFADLSLRVRLLIKTYPVIRVSQLKKMRGVGGGGGGPTQSFGYLNNQCCMPW